MQSQSIPHMPSVWWILFNLLKTKFQNQIFCNVISVLLHWLFGTRQ
jgi:hypothetical protein